jgi:hypothetical protein
MASKPAGFEAVLCSNRHGCKQVASVILLSVPHPLSARKVLDQGTRVVLYHSRADVSVDLAQAELNSPIETTATRNKSTALQARSVQDQMQQQQQ